MGSTEFAEQLLPRVDRLGREPGTFGVDVALGDLADITRLYAFTPLFTSMAQFDAFMAEDLLLDLLSGVERTRRGGSDGGVACAPVTGPESQGDPLLEGAQALLAHIDEHAMIDMWERTRAEATSWIIELHDPSDTTRYGPREFLGPFPTEADAQRDADSILQTVNASLDGSEFLTARVCPLDPPGDWDHERGHAADSPFPHDPDH